MFVSKSKYNELKDKYHKTLLELSQAQNKIFSITFKWNELVDKINAKGGTAFLDTEYLQFTKEEIRILIKFCHPDKHGGSKEAGEITARLLKMRT